MKRKQKHDILFFLVLQVITIKVNAQWILTDTLDTSHECFPDRDAYPAFISFVNADTTYYYFNDPKCSPSSQGGCQVLRRDNPNSPFTRIIYAYSISSYGPIVDLSFNSNVGFMSSINGSHYSVDKTINAGSSWNSVPFSSLNYKPDHLILTNGDSGFAISNSGILYKYFNDTLRLLDTINFTQCFDPKMIVTKNNFAYIIARDSTSNLRNKVLRSNDAGNTWSVSLSGTGRSYFDIAFLTDSIGYLGSDTGLYYTNNAGMSWTLINSQLTYCHSIELVNSNLIYMLSGGKPYITINAGITWSQQTIPAGCYPISISMINNTVGFIHAIDINTSGIGEALILKTTNGGGSGLIVNEIAVKKSKPFSIEPNPSTGQIQISLPLEFENDNEIQVKIFNSLGNLIKENLVESNPEKIELNLGEIAKGIYFIHINGSYGKCSGKLIIN